MSLSLRMHEQFEKRKPFRFVTGLLFIGFYIAYLGWRLTIFNMDSIFLSSMMYSIDVIAFILGIFVIFNAYSGKPDYPKEAAPEGLNVDVFVTTYKEDIDLIKKTVRAALAILYPHRTIILDDGNRQDIKELANSLDITYRARGKNINAKAGNLNYGLTQSTADYIAVFDADHIPQPEALDKLLSLMDDERVGMVQTPQEFYNIDGIQFIDRKKDRSLWNEQTFFYNTMQVCNNKDNCMSGVGTGVIYRRKALDDIGGIPVETVTEDVHTSLQLQKAGWLTRYISEAVAYGVAAADITEFYTTRKRWIHGTFDAVCKENVLFCKELNWRQKVAYIRGGVVCLAGFQKLLMGILPSFSLFFALQPFEITAFNILIVMALPILAHFLLQEFNQSRFWPSNLLSWLLFPIQIVASAAIFGRKMPWKSSLKNFQSRIDYQLLTPQISLAVLNFCAVIFAVWRLYPNYEAGPLLNLFLSPFTSATSDQVNFFTVLKEGYTLDLVLVAGFWALFNVVSVFSLIRFIQKKAQASEKEYQFYVEFPLEIKEEDDSMHYAVTRKCSLEKLEFSVVGNTDEMPLLSEKKLATLYTISGPINITLSGFKRKKEEYIAKVGFYSLKDKERLEDSLYSVSWHRSLYHYQGRFQTSLEKLMSLLSFKKNKKTPDVKPLLLKPENDLGGKKCFAALKRRNSINALNQKVLVSFETLNIGQKINLTAFSTDGANDFDVHILGEIRDIAKSCVWGFLRKI